MIRVISSVDAIRKQVHQWRQEGLTSALVPTMGGLHGGHLALMESARQQADKVIVSIYVNPTQFAPNEDYDQYPRQLETDLKLINDRADIVFAPDNLYAPDHTTQIIPAGPAIGLESECRPHFFTGVATIVLKLFNQMPVDKAVFGEKDFQQLAVIKKMVSDLDLPIEIIHHPTVRDSDGLALSSRNQYLEGAQLALAKTLYNTLLSCAASIRNGKGIEECLTAGRVHLLNAGFSSVDYLSLCDRLTLEPTDARSDNVRLLVAARLGDIRLIDNIALGEADDRQN